MKRHGGLEMAGRPFATRAPFMNEPMRIVKYKSRRAAQTAGSSTHMKYSPAVSKSKRQRAMKATATRSIALVALIGTALWSPPARGCAPAPPEGEQVVTQREDALIVWDPASHREHFVRRALFGGVTKEFGFLVPTPSRPELAEVSEGVFASLAQATQPAVVTQTKWVAAPIGCSMLPFLLLRASSRASEAPQAASAVTMLEQKQVAGLDATVLEASDAKALATWLTARGFAFRPALVDWVEPYLQRGWTITAFRYASDARLPDPNLASRALRMSFVTQQPIYPYREPLDQPVVAGRELHLFLLAPTRLEAVPSELMPSWPAALRFSALLPLPGGVQDGMPGVVLNRSMWLGEYRDPTGRRPAVDLAFIPSATAREVRPDPVVVYDEKPVPIPYEAPLVLGAVGWWWQRRRARAAA